MNNDIDVRVDGKFDLQQLEYLDKKVIDFSITEEDINYLKYIYPGLKAQELVHTTKERVYLSNYIYQDNLIFLFDNLTIRKTWKGLPPKLMNTEFIQEEIQYE